jgi:hypothetical protein
MRPSCVGALPWALVALAAVAAQRGSPDFQDEISERANRALPAVGRGGPTGSAFQDGVWTTAAQPRDADRRAPNPGQAGGRGLSHDDTRSLYREPFQLGVDDVSDEQLSALVAAAGDRVVAALKKADPRHDGRLRGADIAR